MFKLWSESNPDVLVNLKPDLWMRGWNDLTSEEKKKMWKYIEDWFFFIDDTTYNHRTERHEYSFPTKDIYLSGEVFSLFIRDSILRLNESYKHKTYWARYLRSPKSYEACEDFYDIFLHQDENVVLELLSFYADSFIKWSIKERKYLQRDKDENDDEYHDRFNRYQYSFFDKFSSRINEVFTDFWVKWQLTRIWFWPRQSEEIIQKVYEPVLKFLSDKKFEVTNRELGDAFNDYQKWDYSWSVTKTISAIQAFLQISVRWEIGKGDIAELINDAISANLIPTDIFTETIFKNLKSIIMRERQETADAHPKLEYANEQNARLILNLSMVFIQHFMQLQK